MSGWLVWRVTPGKHPLARLTMDATRTRCRVYDHKSAWRFCEESSL